MKIRRLVKQLVVISTVVCMGLGLTGCGAKATSGTLDKDTLVVGLDDTFAPMGFRDENGEITGFDIDLAKAMGEKLGKTIEFQSIDWNMKETELNGGNIDFIWNGYSISDERKKQVDFSVPYLKNRQIIITLADSDIATKADLEGKVVAAQTGSTAVDAIEAEPEVMATFKDGKPVTYESNNDFLYQTICSNYKGAKAYAADEIIIRYYISKKGEEKYKILEEDFGEEEYGVGMRKGDTAMVEAFNKAYKELKDEGVVAIISTKWFGEDITC